MHIAVKSYNYSLEKIKLLLATQQVDADVRDPRQSLTALGIILKNHGLEEESPEYYYKIVQRLSACTDLNGDTYLHEAGSRFHVANTLLKNGADPDAANDDGNNALYTLIPSIAHYLQRMRELNRPPYHDCFDSFDDMKHSLESAMKTCSALLRYGANPLKRNKRGKNCMDLVHKYKYDKLTKIIEDHLSLC